MNLKTIFRKKTNPIWDYLASIEIDDCFYAENKGAADGIANFICLNNDPKIRKMFLKIEWSNDTETKYIKEYSDKCFKNVLLLNNVSSEPMTLDQKIQEAIENENYELASRLSKSNKPK
jgi:hypothetical protein